MHWAPVAFFLTVGVCVVYSFLEKRWERRRAEASFADTASACERLQEAIDDLGGNPSWPHGGTPLNDSLWHLANALLNRDQADKE